MIPTPERRPFPLGQLTKPRVLLCRAAQRPPLLVLNRYPGQVIGFGVRLPQQTAHLYLSVVWATPSRWWA